MKSALPNLDQRKAIATRLPVRLLALLTLALLPIGLIAVLQTVAVVEEVSRINQRDILVRTADAANAEMTVVQRAFGSGKALGSMALAFQPDSDECTTMFREFVDKSPEYVLALFIDPEGQAVCSSRGEPADLSDSQIVRRFYEKPRSTIAFTSRGAVSGMPVMVVMTPIYAGNELRGAVSLSIPHLLSETLLLNQIEDVDVAILNGRGEVITASVGMERANEFRHPTLIPEEMLMGPLGTTRKITSGDGEERLYAVVPLLAGEAYVVGQWASDRQPYTAYLFGTVTPVFPILMWLASLFVAYLAIDRLVLRHLNVLRRRMARFSLERPERQPGLQSYAPSEVAEISDSFNVMIDRIIQDHAELEDSVHEKDILLKEVHHRVKNNLQLIASILNMQLRTIESEDARKVLRRVQDRVISLSLIHKLLYTDVQVDTVRADLLLKEIIDSVLSIGEVGEETMRRKVDLSPVTLDPDQAVPLSLLVTEAITNAIKYAGSGPEPGLLRIVLTAEDQGRVRLVVANSRSPNQTITQGDDGTGLGLRLIQAFVSQLGGEIEIVESDEEYKIDVHFVKLGTEGEPKPLQVV